MPTMTPMLPSTGSAEFQENHAQAGGQTVGRSAPKAERSLGGSLFLIALFVIWLIFTIHDPGFGMLIALMIWKGV